MSTWYLAVVMFVVNQVDSFFGIRTAQRKEKYDL